MLAASSALATRTCRNFRAPYVPSSKSFEFRTLALVKPISKGTTMLNQRIIFALAIVVLAACVAESREEGPQNMANALRMLQELDRYYTQASRPRIDRRDVADGDRVDPDLLDRAVRLLQLHNLDRIYSYHTRPRYGKRSDAFTNWAKDTDKPDLPAWLSYARRR